jgi:AcrR family transcriptional regulator
MNETQQTIVNATFALAAEMPWSRIQLHQIAARAGISLADLYKEAPTKHMILCLLSRQVNEAVLRGHTVSAESTDTPRERLFEVLMARFDALRPFRAGLKSVADDLSRDPGAAALLALLLPGAMAWMLEAANIDTTGMNGPVKTAVLTALYAKVLRTWLAETGEDDARTMAELDRRLKQTERWLK